jgi:hypothetical protein
MPTVDYENVIVARGKEIAATITVEHLAPQYRTPEHRAKLVAQALDGVRARFEEYRVLGNFYADQLENPETPADVVNVLGEELLDLADRANLHNTSPVVLRLLYPLMRHYAREREKGRRAAD